MVSLRFASTRHSHSETHFGWRKVCISKVTYGQRDREMEGWNIGHRRQGVLVTMGHRTYTTYTTLKTHYIELDITLDLG